LYLFDKKDIEKIIQKASSSLNKNGILIITDHDADITFQTSYTKLREFIMLRILHLTHGTTLTFNPHHWWLKILEKNFTEVKYLSLDKSGFQKMYICKK